MNNQLKLSFEDNETKIEDVENSNEILVSAAKAMKILELSRHNFEKVIQEGLLSAVLDEKKKLYKMDDIEKFMKTDRYDELVNGTVDPRNNLNDLTGKDWLPETKRAWSKSSRSSN